MADYIKTFPGDKGITNKSGTVQRLIKDYGGPPGQEGALLNGLVAMGYDPALIHSLADADPNRRYLDDAVTRALRAGVTEDDIKRSLKATRAAATGDPAGAAKALGIEPSSLPPDSLATYQALTSGKPLPYLDRGQPGGAGAPTPTPPAPAAAPAPAGAKPGAPGGPPAAPTPPAMVPSPAGSNAARAQGKAGPAGTPGGLVTSKDQTSVPKPMNPADAEKVITDKYGYMGSLLQNPEIHKILYGIASGTIAEDQFQNQLMTTDWFKGRSDNQQAWEVMKATKPEEAKNKIKTTSDQVKSFAVSMGFTIDDETASQIATSTFELGWDETQMRQAVGTHYVYTTGKSPVAGVAEQLKMKAADYLMPLGDEAITQWGQQIINGTSTIDQFVDYARGNAKVQYPGLGVWLDQDPSRTVKQFVEPYAQKASDILEVPAGTIDFTQDKYGALFGRLDSKTGDRAIMTGPEWSQYLKQQPEWQYTKNAHDTVANLTDTLARTFGQVG